jgi:hypothetical protein
MSTTEDTFDAELAAKFPKMFAQPYGGCCVDTGWQQIITSLCANIQYYIDQRNDRRCLLIESNPYKQNIPDEVPQVVVEQIKEKFGGLRFYYSGGDDTISGMVSMAESWASHTCETCGKPGRQRSGGWIRTLCDEHEAERQEKFKQRLLNN